MLRYSISTEGAVSGLVRPITLKEQKVQLE